MAASLPRPLPSTTCAASWPTSPLPRRCGAGGSRPPGGLGGRCVGAKGGTGGGARGARGGAASRRRSALHAWGRAATAAQLCNAPPRGCLLPAGGGDGSLLHLQWEQRLCGPERPGTLRPMHASPSHAAVAGWAPPAAPPLLRPAKGALRPCGAGRRPPLQTLHHTLVEADRAPLSSPLQVVPYLDADTQDRVNGAFVYAQVRGALAWPGCPAGASTQRAACPGACQRVRCSAACHAAPAPPAIAAPARPRPCLPLLCRAPCRRSCSRMPSSWPEPSRTRL